MYSLVTSESCAIAYSMIDAVMLYSIHLSGAVPLLTRESTSSEKEEAISKMAVMPAKIGIQIITGMPLRLILSKLERATPAATTKTSVCNRPASPCHLERLARETIFQMASQAFQELRKAGVLDNGHWKDGWFAGDDVYRHKFKNGAALFVGD